MFYYFNSFEFFLGDMPFLIPNVTISHQVKNPKPFEFIKRF